MKQKIESNHAISNAQGEAENIIELYRAFNTLTGGAKKAEACGEEFDTPEDVTNFAVEMALSVEVRSGWHPPSDSSLVEPVEYRILLSWGGPSCQITGDIGSKKPIIQHQDWFTLWTDYKPDNVEWREAVNWFVGCFYFGD